MGPGPKVEDVSVARWPTSPTGHARWKNNEHAQSGTPTSKVRRQVAGSHRRIAANTSPWAVCWWPSTATEKPRPTARTGTASTWLLSRATALTSDLTCGLYHQRT